MLPHDTSSPTITQSFSGGCPEGGNFRIRGPITRDATLGPGMRRLRGEHSAERSVNRPVLLLRWSEPELPAAAELLTIYSNGHATRIRRTATQELNCVAFTDPY